MMCIFNKYIVYIYIYICVLGEPWCLLWIFKFMYYEIKHSVRYNQKCDIWSNILKKKRVRIDLHDLQAVADQKGSVSGPLPIIGRLMNLNGSIYLEPSFTLGWVLHFLNGWIRPSHVRSYKITVCILLSFFNHYIFKKNDNLRIIFKSLENKQTINRMCH